MRPRRPDELDTARGGGILFNQVTHQIEIVRALGGGMVRSVRAYAGSLERRDRPKATVRPCLSSRTARRQRWLEAPTTSSTATNCMHRIAEGGTDKPQDRLRLVPRTWPTPSSEPKRQKDLGYGGRQSPVEPTCRISAFCSSPASAAIWRLSPNGITAYGVDGVLRESSGARPLAGRAKATRWMRSGPRCARAVAILTMPVGAGPARRTLALSLCNPPGERQEVFLLAPVARRRFSGYTGD